MQIVIFGILAVVTIAAALMVVLSHNLFRSALWLVLAFFGIAGVFILLHAEFLAIAQVLVYVGAISTLVIFAIMLSNRMMDPRQPPFNSQVKIVGGIAFLLFVALAGVVLRVKWPVAVGEVPADAIQRLGADFVGSYVIPFEVASVLLVAAMIGAIIIAREQEH